MDLWDVMKRVGKGVLSLVPGGGAVVAGLELASGIAEAVGGETGQKIAEGARLVAEGLDEAGRQPVTPEMQLKLDEAAHRHAERMAEISLARDQVALADAEGGRDLAKAEIASEDEYVRRTRPMLLRWYGKGAFLLVAAAVLLAFLCGLTRAVDKEEAAFIVDVLQWALPSLSGTFLLMYRAYTGKRTEEKLAEAGLRPEGLLDKLARLKTAGQGAR